MATYLITGAARGLGLAFSTYLAARPATEVGIVFAAARNESSELKELVEGAKGRVVFVRMEVTVEASVERGVKAVEEILVGKGKGLDVLINNAGMNSWTPDWLVKPYVLYFSYRL
jgi:NAD(P)-dependent dehydrogenase (short-subunit alcohol dehydrogenase family)